MVKVPVDSKINLPKKIRNQANNTTDYFLKNSGLFNDHINEVIPNIALYGNEKHLPEDSPSNCFILFGRDRLRGATHGYGGRGNSHAGAIDIVVGFSGRLARVDDPDGDNKIFTNKSPELDAARIYISQKTDVDNDFSLADGKVGNQTARSGIVIKADAVRIVAREGLKLVTGTDVFNSQGVRIAVPQGIDLIAQNKGKLLQPLVLGNNLINAMKDQNDRLTDLGAIVTSLIELVMKHFMKIAAHTHIATPIPLVSPPSPDLILTTATTEVQLGLLTGEILEHKKNISLHNKHFYDTKNLGKGYILSPYNNTN